MALEEALKFSPHIVFYTAAGREQWNTISFLADILAEGVEIPYPELKQIVAEAGVSPGMSRPDILQRLKPYDETLLAWVYGRIERLCAADGMRQVWIYQIGRASCRERVCQYVSISVVGVSFKNKKQ